MQTEQKDQNNYLPEDYDTPNIIGEIDTVSEEIEYLEKKKKVPVFLWLFIIIIVALIAFYLTTNQSPTLIFGQ